MDNITDFLQNVQSDERFQNLNEAAIKQGIVLKILSQLEWDPFNIDEIEPEYSLKDGKIDFVLKHNESLKVFLGVKKELDDFEGEAYQREKTTVILEDDHTEVEAFVYTLK